MIRERWKKMITPEEYSPPRLVLLQCAFAANSHNKKSSLSNRASGKDVRLVTEEHRLRIKNNLSFPPVSLATDL
jgi:hypothetical protein